MRIPKKDGLNIVPFIDVMLVLLAIVLSVSTFIAQGQIKVELPYASQN
ncbi:biopolymer transporter ExbD, partial [Helicobacter typhlonius]